MARKRIATSNARIDAVRHKDKRKNILTEELRRFVRGVHKEDIFVELECR